MTKDDYLTHMYWLAWVAFFDTHHGGASPSQNMINDRLRTPLIGDIVIETSSNLSRPKHPPIGKFRARLFDSAWPFQAYEQRWNEFLWLIKDLRTGELVNWGNCDFRVAYTRKVQKELEKADCNHTNTWHWRQKAERYRELRMKRVQPALDKAIREAKERHEVVGESQ